MNRSGFTAAALLVVLSAGSTVAAGQERDRARTQDPDRAQARDRDPIRDREIYGSQLMTRQERDEYRTRMRAAKTQEERDRIRAEHHDRMKERAKERGAALPDTPPERGGGMGPRGDMPSRGDMGPRDMGPGGGMGAGRGGR